jgi:hypothetical protein
LCIGWFIVQNNLTLYITAGILMVTEHLERKLWTFVGDIEVAGGVWWGSRATIGISSQLLLK